MNTQPAPPCPKCGGPVTCRYNHFEKPGLVIDSWEHKCADCGVRETQAFRSEGEPDPAARQCPYCGREGCQRLLRIQCLRGWRCVIFFHLLRNGTAGTGTMTNRIRPSQMIEVGVEGWGYARLSFDETQGLRKTVPRWAAADAPLHFFKYADEQTILAVRALDNAIERHGLEANLSDWAVIAAPQFLGRLAGATAFHRFLKGGAPGVSLHTIPQHSLHSVSGAISVLLGCHGPNVGVGGGPQAMSDALLTASTLFDQRQCSGVWLVCTGWSPEPLPNLEGKCDSTAVCHAFALALKPAGNAARCGTLQLRWDGARPQLAAETPAAVEQVVDQLIKLDSLLLPCTFRWPLDWGATAQLQLAPLAQRVLQAA